METINKLRYLLLKYIMNCIDKVTLAQFLYMSTHTLSINPIGYIENAND